MGPIDGRPIYVDPFVQGFQEFKKRKKPFSWPDAIHYFNNDRIVVVLDDADLKNRGEKLFKGEILNESKLKNNYKKWIEITKEVECFEKTVNSGLRDFSDKELLKSFSEFDDMHIDFWVEGFLPELSNWGGEKILKELVEKYHPNNYIEILEKLGAPEDLSFFQKEEKELLELKFIKNKKELEKKLTKHQQKYYWLENSYCFTKELDVDHFKKILSRVSIQKAKEKIKEIKNHKKNTSQAKKEIIKKYKIKKEIVDVAEKLTYCIVWQDFRKKYIFILNHIISKFVQEISQRNKIPFKSLCYYAPKEIKDLLMSGKKISTTERYRGFWIYYDEKKNSIWYVSGEKAIKMVQSFLKTQLDKKIKEFKGAVVSLGRKSKVKGIAKILKTPRNLEKMKKGNILVASMTSPDYILAMRKASAILTDEGGMTCHAAIVSRELKIPCLVSTKIATKVLKDGDEVEVDANKGVVKIINKKL